MNHTANMSDSGPVLASSGMDGLSPHRIMATAAATPPPNSEHLSANYLAQVFPQLTFNELLGNNMATVYRATQHGLNREVVFKAFAIESSTNDSDVDRFRREAEAVANLKHTNIVTVHDFGLMDGIYYFIMDYLPGKNLREAVEGQRWSVREKAETLIEWMSAICSAVQSAHDVGIVHRDIKPDNIILDENGAPVLIDFGIAKHRQSSVFQTQTGDVVGTPSYMSPEQRQDSSRVDRRTDIYALGAVLLELWTLQPPLRRSSPSEHGSLNPNSIDQQIRRIASIAMSNNPAARFQSANDFKRALHDVIHRPQVARRRTARMAKFAAKLVLTGANSSIHCLLFTAIALSITDAGLLLGYFIFGEYHGERVALDILIDPTLEQSDKDALMVAGLFHEATGLGPDFVHMRQMVLLFATGGFLVGLALNTAIAFKQRELFALLASYFFLSPLCVIVALQEPNVETVALSPETFENAVPDSMQIERARAEIQSVDDATHELARSIARLESDRDRLEEEANRKREQIEMNQDRCDQLRRFLASSDHVIEIDGRTYARDEVETDLRHRESAIAISQTSLQTLDELLADKSRELTEDQRHLNRLLNQKRELELQIARLEAQRTMHQLSETEMMKLDSEFENRYEDTDEIESKLDEIEARVDIDSSWNEGNGSINRIPVEKVSDNVVGAVAEFFESGARD